MEENLDITKTGGLTYNELLEANAAPYSPFNLEDFIKEVETTRALIKGHSPSISEQKMQSSLYMTDTPLGESAFDKDTYTIEELGDIQDIRAENQSGTLKITNGLGKGAVLAGTTFLNGTVGFLYGTGKAIATQDPSAIWNNEIALALNVINEKSEEIMPNYYTEYELTHPFTISANFIGDKFIKNLGFAVGAVGSYMLGGGAAKAGIRGLTKGLVGAKIMAPTLSNIRTMSNISTAASSFLGGAVSAVGEASIEALHGSDEFAEEQVRLLDYVTQLRTSKAEQDYNQNKGKLFINTDLGLIDVAYLKYQQDIQKIKTDYGSSLERINQNKTKVGNGILAAQIPMLMASNIFQFGKLFTKGFTGAKALGKELTGEIGQYKTSKTLAKGVAKYIGNAAVEGSEEMGQRIISDISKSYYTKDTDNFYRQRINPHAEVEVLDLMNETMNVLKSTITDASAWEEFTIGALTGALGIPGFRSVRNKKTGAKQSPIYLRGGVQELLDYRREMLEELTLANELNSRVQAPEFLSYYQGLIRHKSYDAIMQDAALRDDRFDYKNAERALLISDIIMFDKAGKLGDLQLYIKLSTSDLTDADLDAIVDATSNKTGDKVIGPYIDSSGVALNTTEEGKEQMRQLIAKNAEEMSQTITDYQRIKGDIEFLSNYSFNDDLMLELIYLKAMSENSNKRINSIIEELDKYVDNTTKLILAFLEGTILDTATSDKTSEEVAKLNTDIFLRLLNYLKLSTEAKAIYLSTFPLFREFLQDVVLVYTEKDISKSLEDILKLLEAKKVYSDKFKEFMESPTKLQESINNSKTETVKQKEKIKTDDINDSIKNAKSTLDIVDIITRAEDESQAKDLIKKAAREGNTFALSYLDAQTTKQSVLDSMANIEGVSQENLDMAEGVIDALLNAEAQLENILIELIEDVARNLGVPEEQLSIFAQNLEDALAEHLEKKILNESFEGMPEYEGDDTGEQGPPVTPPINDSEVPLSNDFVVEGESTELVPTKPKTENNPPIAGNTSGELPKSSTPNAEAVTQTGDIITIVPYYDLNQLKQGKFIPFKETNPLFTKLYDFLVKKKAFEYVDLGNLKLGTTIKLAILQEFNEEVLNESWYKKDRPTIFMVTESGLIVGVLKASNISTELVTIRKEVTDGWINQGTGADYIHSTEFLVNKLVAGHGIYKETKFLSQIEIPEVHLGIVKNGTLVGDNKTTGKIKTLKDIKDKEGFVYLLVPGADGQYVPTAVVMNNFNRDNWENADNVLTSAKANGHRVNILINALNKYLPTIENSWNSLYTNIANVLYLPDNVHFNIRKGTKSGKLWLFIDKAAIDLYGAEVKDNKGNRVLDKSFNNGQTVMISLLGDIQETSKSIINALLDLNLRFNVNANYLSNILYIESIVNSDILSSNIEKGYLQGGYFGIEQKPITPKQEEKTPIQTVGLIGILFQGTVNDDLFADDYLEGPTITLLLQMTAQTLVTEEAKELSNENKLTLEGLGISPADFVSLNPELQDKIEECNLS